VVAVWARAAQAGDREAAEGQAREAEAVSAAEVESAVEAAEVELAAELARGLARRANG
jgi:hypothetical protein